MTDMAYIVSRTLEHKIAIAENNDQNTLIVTLDVLKEILAVLKEQEPIEPVDDGHGSLICGNQGYECGCVGSYNLKTKAVDKFCNFCPECGRKVKWE